MNRRDVVYNIYRVWARTEGIPWPGEHWDGPFTLAEARKAMKTSYKPTGDGAVFRIVKNTLEVVE